MPDQADPLALRVVPDLLIEVADARGATRARLVADEHDASVLVLDVDDPAVFARCLPRTGRRPDLRGTLPPALRGAPAVRVTSHGRRLGGMSTSGSGRVRVQVAPRGALAGARIALGGRERSAAAALAAVLALVLTWRLARR